MAAPRKKKSSAAAAKLAEIDRRLLGQYGPQKCFLEHETPFQLLVATILSAQCTDRMVNRVTAELFKTRSRPEDFASMEPAELEPLIHSCGYYRAKAKNIVNASRTLVEQFHSEMPRTMEELTRLPGVGRKTANVVLADAFGVPGLPVDTHVTRIANLLGVTSSQDPVRIEAELCASLAPERWGEFSHLLIVHGRTTCPAGRPKCGECVLADLCRHHAAERRKKKA
ncbi:MAG: endonuclease III [Lentisphaeria bacterium]|nr:endonuclease III [Lentisphaeria bacterium]